jgi:hypothetical protein
VKGDATVSGAAGEGILIVDGRLVIIGAVTYSGVIVARDGVISSGPGLTILGMIRAAGDPPLSGPIQLTRSEAAVQGVLSKALTPTAVAGRRWAEMH